MAQDHLRFCACAVNRAFKGAFAAGEEQMAHLKPSAMKWGVMRQLRGRTYRDEALFSTTLRYLPFF
jgi:hypothetical protein